jgi:predicted amidohydrolase
VAPEQLTLAAAQFQVSADMQRNLAYIIRLMRKAALAEADLVTFPECAQAFSTVPPTPVGPDQRAHRSG